MAILETDINLFRGKSQYTDLYINAFPPTVQATATVSATPTTYPIGQISVSGTSGGWSDVRIGQMYIIRDDDGNKVSTGVVRRTPTSNILYIDGKAQGDPGFASRIIYSIEQGQTVTIYKMQPLWSLLSRINNGVFYKKFDRPYVDQGSNPAPVANIGQWRVERAVGGYAEVTFTTAGCYAWNGKTITGRVWNKPDDSVYIDGSSTTEEITLRIPEGHHILICTITDSGGATKRAIRPIWVIGDTYQALNEQYAVQIESDNQTRQGRTISLQMWGDDLGEDVILPGTAFAIKEYPVFEGQTLTPGIFSDLFVGFAQDRTMLYDPDEKKYNLTIASPFDRMGFVPMVSQAVIEVASPSKWTHILTGLGDPNMMIWYLLEHHTTYLDMFDFIKLDETPPRKKRWGFSGNTVAEYLTQVSQSIYGNIGTISDGSLYLRRTPSIENNAYRVALEEKMTITTRDLSESVQIALALQPKLSQQKAFAFAYSGNRASPVASIAYGLYKGQAVSEGSDVNLILRTTTPQAKINEIAGHILAEQNSPIPEVPLKLNRNMDIIEPAEMLWWRLELDGSYSSTNEDLDMRMVANTVTRAWEQTEDGDWIKTISATFVPETFGQAGILLPMTRGQGGSSSNPPRFVRTRYNQRRTFVRNVAGGVIFAWNDEGKVGRTYDGESWQDITGDLGQVHDITVDYHSSFVSSGYTSGDLGAWAVCSDGDTTLEVWYTQSLLDSSIVWELQDTFTMNDNSCQTTARIVSSREDADMVGLAWKDRVGIWFASTTDGLTWSDPVSVGGSSGDEGLNDNAEIGLTIKDNVVVVTGMSGGFGNAAFVPYWATLPTPSFEQVNTPSGFNVYSNIPYPMLLIGKDGNLYATTGEVTWNQGFFYQNFTDYGNLDYEYTVVTTDLTVDKDTPIVSNAQAPELKAGDAGTAEIDVTFTLPVPISTDDYTGNSFSIIRHGGTLPSRTYEWWLYDEDNNVLANTTTFDPNFSSGIDGIKKVRIKYTATTTFSGTIDIWRFSIGLQNCTQDVAYGGFNYCYIMTGHFDDPGYVGDTDPTSGDPFIFFETGEHDILGTDELTIFPSGERTEYTFYPDPDEYQYADAVEFPGGSNASGRITFSYDVADSNGIRFILTDKPDWHQISFSHYPYDAGADYVLTLTWSFYDTSDTLIGQTTATLTEQEGIDYDYQVNNYIPEFSEYTGVKRFTITLEVDTTHTGEAYLDWGGGGFFCYQTMTSATEPVGVFSVDNDPTTRKLYRISDFDDATPTWTDITPATGTPNYPYALVFDAVGTTNIAALANTEGDSTQDYYISANAGNSYNLIQSSTAYKGLRKSGSVVMAWGDGVLVFSKDNLATPFSLVGDWDSAIGTVGTYKGIIAIF